ncbi:hypothetical protein [Microbacterium sp. PMB16]|uniref:hypothetical protein n=1 Tax=Microbacterium sp. PMB16 TaxID=3120157 RepID=UPI003F4BEED8
MPSWTAVAFGALDLRGTELEEQGFELVVVPVAPGTPVFLMGRGAEIWRALLEDNTDRIDAADDAGEILAALEDMGIASRDSGHRARVTMLDRPWLVSAFHELVYALIARVAESEGIDVVFIKGPTLHAQGLREREHSGDVDCWVRPGDDLRLAAAMRDWGWTPLLSPFTGTGVTHSLTLEASEWGCAIDVHVRYPGMDIDPASAFAIALDASEPRVFAATVCATPRKALHGVIAALHSVRPFIGAPAGEASIDAAAMALRAAGEETVDFAERVNAVYALETPLQRAFPEAGLAYPGARPPADWAWRLTASAPRRHLRALLTVPARQQPAVLWRLVWPSAEVLRAAGEAPNTSLLGRAGSRVRRLAAAAILLVKR